MNTTVTTAISAVAYLLASVLIWRSAMRPSHNLQWAARILAVTGWLLQGITLYHLIDVGSEQNLSLSNLSAMIAWMMLALIALSNQRSQVKLLVIVMLVVAASSQAMAEWLPGERLFSLKGQSAATLHILISLLAYSVLAVCALEALMVWWQDTRLKHKTSLPSPLFPPLLAMEKLLFQTLAAGFTLLTASMAIALIYLQPGLTQQPAHKLLLSIAAWVLFGLLLGSHWRYGWRGQQAARLTLAAFMLLALGYFGTWIVLHGIMGR